MTIGQRIKKYCPGVAVVATPPDHALLSLAAETLVAPFHAVGFVPTPAEPFVAAHFLSALEVRVLSVPASPVLSALEVRVLSVPAAPVLSALAAHVLSELVILFLVELTVPVVLAENAAHSPAAFAAAVALAAETTVVVVVVAVAAAAAAAVAALLAVAAGVPMTKVLAFVVCQQDWLSEATDKRAHIICA